jgi:alkylhydroperoxidase family enzyme
MFRPDSLERALELLGDLLADRDQHFEVVAIGGGGLQLIGVIDRPTKDIDLVALIEGGKLVGAGTFPAALAEAIADVARSLNLSADWMNGAPASLLDSGLPAGFQDRLEHRKYGRGLDLSLASRFDQIHFKLYAATDDAPGGKHHVDLKKLQPSPQELRLAAEWAKTQDPSEGFAGLVVGVLRDFGIED